jgi:hypothetical protein
MRRRAGECARAVRSWPDWQGIALHMIEVERMSRRRREFSHALVLTLISLGCTNDPSLPPSGAAASPEHAASVGPPAVSNSNTLSAPAASAPAPAAKGGMAAGAASGGALSGSAAGSSSPSTALAGRSAPSAGAAWSGSPSAPAAKSSASSATAGSSASLDAGAPTSSRDDPFFPDPSAGNTTPPPAGMCENLFCFDVFDCAIFHLEEAAVCNFSDCVEFVCKQ